jgi:hypothetical protein
LFFKSILSSMKYPIHKFAGEFGAMPPTQHSKATGHRNGAQQVAHLFQPPSSPRPSVVVVQVPKTVAQIERQLELAGPRKEGQEEVLEQRPNQLVVLFEALVAGEVVVDAVEFPEKSQIKKD